MTESTGSAVLNLSDDRPTVQRHHHEAPKVLHPARADRRAAGKAARERLPLEAQAEYVSDGGLTMGLSKRRLFVAPQG